MKGQFITQKNGKKRKILEVLGDIYFVSYDDNFEYCDRTWTKEQMKLYGFCLPKEEWTPEKGESYWFIGSDSKLYEGDWDEEEYDKNVQSFLGVYRSKSEAEEAKKEIIRKIKG